MIWDAITLLSHCSVMTWPHKGLGCPQKQYLHVHSYFIIFWFQHKKDWYYLCWWIEFWQNVVEIPLKRPLKTILAIVHIGVSLWFISMYCDRQVDRKMGHWIDCIFYWCHYTAMWQAKGKFNNSLFSSEQIDYLISWMSNGCLQYCVFRRSLSEKTYHPNFIIRILGDC